MSEGRTGGDDGPPDDGTRYAIVLSGGVGDGPWMAGAALEVLEALEAGAGRADVLVGADAGALVAAVAARGLAVNRTLLPFLRKLWGETLNASLWYGDPAGRAAGRRRKGLDDISRALITADPASDDRPSPAVASRLRVGVLNGGRETFDVEVPCEADDPAWEGLRIAALGPAPSPLGTGLPSLPGGNASHGATPRAAGPWGPVGLARRLARGTAGSGARVLVTIDAGDVGDGVPAPGEDGSAAALGDARGLWFDALVDRLPEIADGLRDPDALSLGHIVSRLAEDVAAQTAEGSEDEALEALDAALERIPADPRYAGTIGSVETRAGRTRIAKLIYVLDAVADLDRVDTTRIRVGRGEAAGPVLFDPAARRRAFEAGRREAARALRAAIPGIETPTDPDAVPAAPGPAASPAVTREALEAFVDREADALLDAVPAGGIWRALGWLWKPATREWIRELARRRLSGTG